MLIKKITQYFEPRDISKVTYLLKRIMNCSGIDIDMDKRKIVIESKPYSFQDFVDFLQLCISRRKPSNSVKIMKYINLLAANDFPLHLISNSHVKTLIKEVDDIYIITSSLDKLESRLEVTAREAERHGCK